ncbi:hypothetical protein N7512_002637 [Penicillium capsulatum]|nr:hypothetical protein N7512_002637 [Penicillium capsulatum]
MLYEGFAFSSPYRAPGRSADSPRPVDLPNKAGYESTPRHTSFWKRSDFPFCRAADWRRVDEGRWTRTKTEDKAPEVDSSGDDRESFLPRATLATVIMTRLHPRGDAYTRKGYRRESGERAEDDPLIDLNSAIRLGPRLLPKGAGGKQK